MDERPSLAEPDPAEAERPVACLAGATGTGKSEVAIAVARRVGGEVVCCDAMTVYRGLSVLTAKPSPPPDVPHHLLDVLAPEETYSAGRFVADADRAVDDVRRRGRVPVVVGGTALYLKAWAKGMGPRVGRDPGLRRRLAAIAAEGGARALHERLRGLDPVRATQVHENDERRIVRALEIIEATGRPASAFRAEWSGPDRRPVAVVVLRREPADLRARIEARVAAMAAAGLVDEVAAFLRDHPRASPEVRKTLGLSDVADHLAGRVSLEEALARIAAATRRLARRQATFFRGIGGAWLEVAPGTAPDDVAASAIEAFARAGAL